MSGQGTPRSTRSGGEVASHGSRQPRRAGRGRGAVAALLFDLGGVVIGLDFERVFAAWSRVAGCDASDVRAHFSQDTAYERHERGELDASGYFCSLRGSLRLDLTDAEFLSGWNDLYLGPVEGIDGLLDAASASFPLYAFTNSNPSHEKVWSRRIRRELAYFEAVFVSSNLGMRKPEPDAFFEVAKRIGLLPPEILFFDDSPENVAGAKAVGMQSVLVDSLDDVRRALRSVGLEER